MAGITITQRLMDPLPDVPTVHNQHGIVSEYRGQGVHDIQRVETVGRTHPHVAHALTELLTSALRLFQPIGERPDRTLLGRVPQLFEHNPGTAQNDTVLAHPLPGPKRVDIDAHNGGGRGNCRGRQVADTVISGGTEHQDQIGVEQLGALADQMFQALATGLAVQPVQFGEGRGVVDVNVPYRLMRSEILRPIVQRIPEGTFAPNVIISGEFNRSGARIVNVPVPYEGRTTGTVSIVKWRLWKAAMRSFWQTLTYRGRG